MAQKLPTQTITYKICTVCGNRVDKPHTTETCPYTRNVKYERKRKPGEQEPIVRFNDRPVKVPTEWYG